MMTQGTALLPPVLHLGRPQPVGALTVFPVWTDSPAVGGVGVDPASLEVSELSPDPAVDTLLLANPGRKPVVIFEGELLVGGWQHRMCAADVVVAAGATVRASVVCVEAHRWGGESAHTATGRRAAPSVRAALTPSDAGVAQSRVWQRVDAMQATYGPSPTSSYLDLEHAAAPVAVEYRSLPGQRGVLIGLGGYPLMVELFPSSRVLAAKIKALLNSVLLDSATLSDAGQAGGDVPGRRARRMAARIETLHMAALPEDDDEINADIGRRVAGSDEVLTGRGLLVGDRWAHLSVLDRRHPLAA